MTRRIAALLTVYLLAALPVRAQIAIVTDQTASSATVDLLVTGTDADSTTVESDSGLEIIGTKLTLIRGCSDNQILKWDETEDDWNCEADADSGLWTDGTNGWYANTEAVIVGADAAFEANDLGGGAAGDLKVEDDLEVGNNIYFGASGGSILHGTADGSDTTAIGIGNGITRSSTIGVYGNENGLPGRLLLSAGNVSGADVDINVPFAGQNATILVEAGATDTTYLFADQFTMTSDGTGDAEFSLPDDAIGPDEVLAAGQSDGFLLTYKLTGDTWSWTDPSTITGSGTEVQVNTGGGLAGADFQNGDIDFTEAAGVVTATVGCTDCVTLGAETTGNYVATIADAGSSRITVTGSGSETAAVTLDVAQANLDHGSIGGLTDDDHARYLDTTADDTFTVGANYWDIYSSSASEYGVILGGGQSQADGGSITLSSSNAIANAGGVEIIADDVSSAVINLTTTHASSTIAIRQEDGATDNTLTLSGSGFAFTGNSGDDVSLASGINLRLTESGGANTIDIAAPASLTSYTFTLPTTGGTNGYVLSTNGSGTTSWVAQSGGSVPAKELVYDSASLYCAESSNCAVTLLDNNTNVDALVLGFDDTTAEAVNGKFVVPDAVSTTGSDTVEFSVYFAALNGSCSPCGVTWSFDWVANATAEDFDDAYTAETDGGATASGTTTVLTEATWTETITNLGWTAGDIIHFRVRRLPADSNDTLTGDAMLHTFRILIPRE